jgi:hypothetical protein
MTLYVPVDEGAIRSVRALTGLMVEDRTSATRRKNFILF